MPNDNGHVVSFPSARTPGATVYQDPITPTSRLLPLARRRDPRRHDRRDRVRRLRRHGRRPDQPRRSRQRRGLDRWRRALRRPRRRRRPGRDAPGRDAPARRRAAHPDLRRRAARWSRSQGIDDPSIAGYMLASDLAAKDSTAPVVRVLDPGGPFSPNGDASRDTASIRGRFTESVAWTLRIRTAAARPALRDDRDRLHASRSPGTARSAATPSPDGTYTRQRDRRRRLGQRRRHGHPLAGRRHRPHRSRVADARARSRPNGSRPTATASATRSA